MYFYTHVVHTRVGFSAEIKQSKFRDALISGKRILASRGFGMKSGTEKTSFLVTVLAPLCKRKM